MIRVVDFRQVEGEKNGRKYSFPTLVIADDELNRFTVNVGREDLIEGVLPSFVMDALEKKDEIVADVKFFPNKDDKYNQTAKIEIHNLREA